MMTKIKLLLLLSLPLVAQLTPPFSTTRTGATLPATCGTGNLFTKTGSDAGLYVCGPANTWTGPLGGGGGSGVSSFNTRTGAVVPAQGDYLSSQLGDFNCSAVGGVMTCTDGQVCSFNICGSPGGSTYTFVTLPVASVNTSDPIELTVSSTTPIVNGNYVSIEDASGCDAINGIFVATITGGSTFTIPVDGAACGGYVPSSATAGKNSSPDDNFFDLFVGPSFWQLIDFDAVLDGFIVATTGNASYLALSATVSTPGLVHVAEPQFSVNPNEWADLQNRVPFISASCPTGALTINGNCVLALHTTVSLGGNMLTAGDCDTPQLVTSAFARSGMVVIATPEVDPGSGSSTKSWISADDQITVEVCQAVDGTPTMTTYDIRVIP